MIFFVSNNCKKLYKGTFDVQTLLMLYSFDYCVFKNVPLINTGMDDFSKFDFAKCCSLVNLGGYRSRNMSHANWAPYHVLSFPTLIKSLSLSLSLSQNKSCQHATFLNTATCNSFMSICKMIMVPSFSNVLFGYINLGICHNAFKIHHEFVSKCMILMLTLMKI